MSIMLTHSYNRNIFGPNKKAWCVSQWCTKTSLYPMHFLAPPYHTTLKGSLLHSCRIKLSAIPAGMSLHRIVRLQSHVSRQLYSQNIFACAHFISHDDVHFSYAHTHPSKFTSEVNFTKSQQSRGFVTLQKMLSPLKSHQVSCVCSIIKRIISHYIT